LERTGSNQTLALDWLLNEPNFREYYFNHQVQRFAMAVLSYSTQGTSWNKTKGWLTNNDECSWYQKRQEISYLNGMLHVISLGSNNMNGILPKRHCSA
jgi:hypothetical protein